MFGDNAVSPSRNAEEGFLVKELWYTIQGEGPWAGKPAVFLRLAGCNLRCFFCDTDFSGGTHYKLQDLVNEISTICAHNNCHNVVITGGEPLLQELGLLFTADELVHLLFQIETAGTVWPDSMRDEDVEDQLLDERILIVVSPKTPNLHPKVIEYAHAFKYIVAEGETSEIDGLPNKSTQLPTKGNSSQIYRASLHDFRNSIYIQPCDVPNYEQSAANAVHAAHIVMQYGYRLSLQMHKIVGVP